MTTTEDGKKHNPWGFFAETHALAAKEGLTYQEATAKMQADRRTAANELAAREGLSYADALDRLEKTPKTGQGAAYGTPGRRGPAGTFEGAVAAFRKNGLGPGAAVRQAVDKFPELHKDFLQRIEAGKSTNLNFKEA